MNGLAWVYAIAVVMMAAGWEWQRRHRNIGVVDVLWALGVAIAAPVLAWLGDGAWLPRVALALLGAAWGLRLAMHLWRRVRSEEEDGRYRHLRAHFPAHLVGRVVQHGLLQGNPGLGQTLGGQLQDLQDERSFLNTTDWEPRGS